MIAGTPDRVLRPAVEHPRPPTEAPNRPPAEAPNRPPAEAPNRPPAEVISPLPAIARPRPPSNHPGTGHNHPGTAHRLDIGHRRFLLRGPRSSDATDVPVVRRLPASKRGHKHPNLALSPAGRTRPSNIDRPSSIDRASATSTRLLRRRSVIPSGRHPRHSPLVDGHHRRNARYDARSPRNRRANARNGIGADGSGLRFWLCCWSSVVSSTTSTAR
jgi:hypothetical protein